MKTYPFKPVLLLAMLLLCTLSHAQQRPRDYDSLYAKTLLAPSSPAPDISLKTAEGKKFSLKKLRGKYVVLDFWASWCPDCRKDAPEMARLSKEYGAKGVEFVGVSFDTDKDAWTSAVSQYGLDYTHVSELLPMRESDVAKAFGVKWIPSTVLLSPEGEVVASTVMINKLEKRLTEVTARKNDTIPGSREHLSIDGSKGRLDAILQKPEMENGRQCPLMILCHGFGDKKEAKLFRLIADSLQRRGIASIRFDFNGHGHSDGKFSDMTVPNEIEDARCVLNYVRDLRFVGSVGLLGHSQGGVVAAMLAGQTEPGDISAVVLLAPAGVIRDDAIRGFAFGKFYDVLEIPDSVDVAWGKTIGRKYITTAQQLPIYETAADYHGPAAVIHGIDDRLVPYTYGERFHYLWPGSEMILLKDYDHSFTQNQYRVARLAADYLSKVMMKE